MPGLHPTQSAKYPPIVPDHHQDPPQPFCIATFVEMSLATRRRSRLLKCRSPGNSPCSASSIAPFDLRLRGLTPLLIMEAAFVVPGHPLGFESPTLLIGTFMTHRIVSTALRPQRAGRDVEGGVLAPRRQRQHCQTLTGTGTTPGTGTTSAPAA
jgi:hypothetical protein